MRIQVQVSQVNKKRGKQFKKKVRKPDNHTQYKSLLMLTTKLTQTESFCAVAMRAGDWEKVYVIRMKVTVRVECLGCGSHVVRPCL